METNSNKVTVLDIIRANDVLIKLSKTSTKCHSCIDDMKLPFFIAKAIKLLDTDIVAFNSAKDAINERYKNEQKVYMDGDQPKVFENGTNKILPQYMNDYQNEVANLATTEVDKPNFEFRFTELARNYDLTADDWIKIMPWVNDDSDTIETSSEAPKELK